eukprot:15346575-Ditylum_brightwellii.AAC.1
MSEVVANAKREEADEMTKDINFDRYTNGANYVLLEVAIYLQCQVNVAEESEVIIDTHMDDTDDDNVQDKSDDGQSMLSLLSHLLSNDDDNQSIEIETGLNELFQMLSDESNTDTTFNAQDVDLRNDGGILGYEYDHEEPYDTMDPTN